MMIGGSDNAPGGRFVLLDYESAKLRAVTQSTYGAELRGAADSTGKAFLIAGALHEIITGPKTAEQLVSLTERAELSIPLEVAIDAMAVFSGVTAAEVKPPREANLLMHARMIREWLDRGLVRKLWWVDTRDMLADALTEGAVSRDELTRALNGAVWKLQHQAKCWPPGR